MLTVVLECQANGIAYSDKTYRISSKQCAKFRYSKRTKEIGFYMLQVQEKKISQEYLIRKTFIIGSCSGLLGIFLAWVATFPINNILYKMTESENVAKLDPLHAISLLIISVVLTMIGGWIPSKMAAKKDPVESLRS